MSIFEKFKSKINAEELAASQREINENSGSSNVSREEVPVGKYEVKLEKLECKRSKSSNRPMVSAWFRILEGGYAKSVIFYNGVFHEDWMRHRVVGFLCDMLSDHSEEPVINLVLKSGDVDQINEMLMDIHEIINGNQLEYLLNYGENKGYKTYAIEEVYDAA